jgi:hypothetical protein
VPDSTIIVVDTTGNRFVASRKFLDTGVDAVIYRIADGHLIYQQSDGTFIDAKKARFALFDPRGDAA